MIDPKELRINNAVSFVRDSQWRLRYVKEIGEFGAALHDEKGLFMYSDLFPVPLSPELLEACGFEKDQDGEYSYCRILIGDRVVMYRWVERENMFSEKLLAQPFMRFFEFLDVYFLHQLQNLYFAMTGGTELTVNLEKITT